MSLFSDNCDILVLGNQNRGRTSHATGNSLVATTVNGGQGPREVDINATGSTRAIVPAANEQRRTFGDRRTYRVVAKERRGSIPRGPATAV